MKPRAVFFLVVLYCVVAIPAWPELVLVKDGKAQATIVIPSDAGDLVKHAAEELQTYLERISGAHLEIHADKDPNQGSRILVGSSQAVRDLGVDVPSGFTNQMNEEGFVERTIGADLVLAGNEHAPYRGTLFAVYDFLESLGCRWFFPGPYGEVIPTQKTIATGDINKSEHPDFRFRNIWYSGWMPVSDADRNNYDAWIDHNKMASLAGLSLPGDGTITRLAPPEKYFDSHPEIYALDEKGARVKDMLCLSEPAAVKIAAQTIEDEFRAHPDEMTFGFAPPDGYPRCYCDRCKAAVMGFTGNGFGNPSLSDIWFKFANAVANEVYKDFPDRWLLTNGYANRVRPPEGVGKLSPNLGIQSASIDTCVLHPIGDPHCWQRQLYKGVLDRWTDELKCVFIYDYDPGKSLDGLPFPMLHNLSHDIPYFKQRGVWGFWTEGHNSWMVTHLNYYVRAKLMWNTETDVKTLVHDYCEKFYGAAAGPVEDYIWTLEDAVASTKVHETWGRLMPWQVILTPEIERHLDEALSRASQLAQGDADQLHVKVLSKVQEHTNAFLDMERAAGRGDFAGAVSFADKMLAVRDTLAKIDPALLPQTPEWCRESNGSVEWYRKVYHQLADQTAGAQGDLIALLPAHWEFKTDPEDIGVIYKWYLPGVGAPWSDIDGTLTWDLQGYQDARGRDYAGEGWYRTTFNVPPVAKDKAIRLTVGGVYNSGLWVWVNGMLVDHHADHNDREPFDIDVSGQIRPGEMNSVAILVKTDSADRSPRGGLYRRVFLWSPKAK